MYNFYFYYNKKRSNDLGGRWWPPWSSALTCVMFSIQWQQQCNPIYSLITMFVYSELWISTNETKREREKERERINDYLKASLLCVKFEYNNCNFSLFSCNFIQHTFFSNAEKFNIFFTLLYSVCEKYRYKSSRRGHFTFSFLLCWRFLSM
jgi:hypothetical protein